MYKFTFISCLVLLIAIKSEGQQRYVIIDRKLKSPIHETSFDIGTTKLTVKVIKWTVGDRLNVGLSTDAGRGYKKEYYIVDSKLTNNDNARYLEKLIKYMQTGL